MVNWEGQPGIYSSPGLGSLEKGGVTGSQGGLGGVGPWGFRLFSITVLTWGFDQGNMETSSTNK